MFKPVSFWGKLYKRYLLMGNHPSKVRVQNIWGSLFFSSGILMKDEQGLQFRLAANDWITRIFLKEGGYETGSTTLARKLLSTGGIFIDIGANFGLFTCIAAYRNDLVTVCCVEPNYKVLPALLENLHLNGLENKVKVFNAALSGKPQWVTMAQPATDNLGTTVTRAGSEGLLSILSCPLQMLLDENKIRAAELVKIDIEGNEFQILENFPFEQYEIKNIILEFNHLSKISFENLNVFFISKNFKCYTITGKELFSAADEIPENNIWFVNQKYI